MAKPKSPEYKNGYGDAKADLIRLIKEAMAGLVEASKDDPEYGPSEKDKELLRARIAELKRVRAYIKVLKPKG